MKNINFSELPNYIGKGVIFTGVVYEDNLAQIATDDFKESGFIKNEDEIIEIYKIDGNVRGDEGRSDLLAVLKIGVSSLDPIKRISEYPFVKWVEDFIENYKEDYYS